MNKLYEMNFEGFEVSEEELNRPSPGQLMHKPEPDADHAEMTKEDVEHDMHIEESNAYQNYMYNHLREASVRELMEKFLAETPHDEDLTVENFRNTQDSSRYADDNDIYKDIRAYAVPKGRNPPRDAQYKTTGKSQVGKSTAKNTGPVDTRNFSADQASSELNELMGLMTQAEDDINSVESKVNYKYNTLKELAMQTASGRGQKRHLLVCGDPGIGKTFDLVPAVKKGMERRKNRLKYELTSGSVGRSLTNLLTYFYPRKDGYMIVLDDADDFLTSKDQLINNFLKAMLDPDATAISSPARYRQAADKLIQADKKVVEASCIEINKERLREGILSVSVNGQLLEEENRQEARKLLSLMEKDEETNTRKANALFDMTGRRLYEADIYTDDEFGLDEDDEELISNLLDTDTDETFDGIPSKWYFKSCLCIISNLKLSQVDDAVKSRTTKYELTLERDEFMLRLGQILPFLKVSEDSSMETDEWDWIKNEIFALLAIAIEADKLGAPLNPKTKEPFTIPTDYKLQFRLMYELGDFYTMMADRFSLQFGETDRNKIANGIKIPFLVNSVIPTLCGVRK